MESLDQDEQLLGTLQARFGLSAFRQGQLEAARAMLAGRDLVAVMPTGAGKSLCFQLPALLLDGATVVVSPLIALMKDQVDALRGRGIAAAALHSGLASGERTAVEAALVAGRLSLLYVAPERLGNASFRACLGRARVARLVVDEAHCISQWGHDFRPDYRRLAAVRAELGVPAAAFTATATPDVRADIAVQLGLQAPVELVTGFERQNLTLAVESCRGREDKARALERLLREVGPPGIVYAATRKSVDLWADVLATLGVRTGSYHAGLSDEERSRAQDDFLAGRVGRDRRYQRLRNGRGQGGHPVRGPRGAAGQRGVLLPGGGARGPGWAAFTLCTPLFSGRRSHPGVLPGGSQSNGGHLQASVGGARPRGAGRRNREWFDGGGHGGQAAAAVRGEAPASRWARARRRWTWPAVASRQSAIASGSTPWSDMPSPVDAAPGSSTTTSPAARGEARRHGAACATCAWVGAAESPARSVMTKSWR